MMDPYKIYFRCRNYPFSLAFGTTKTAKYRISLNPQNKAKISEAMKRPRVDSRFTALFVGFVWLSAPPVLAQAFAPLA